MREIKAIDILLSIKQSLTIDNRPLQAAAWSIEDMLKKIEISDEVILDEEAISKFLKNDSNIKVVFSNEDSEKLLRVMRDRWLKEKNDLLIKSEEDKGIMQTYVELLNLVDKLIS